MFKQMAKERRTIRSYTNQIASYETIRDIAQTALYAPTGRNIQHVEMFITRDKAKLKKLAYAKPQWGEFVEDADFAIIIAADANKNPNTYIEDATFVASYLKLAAHEHGIASCWVHIRTAEHESKISSSDYIKKEFGIDDKFTIECVLAFGYPNEEPRRQEFGSFDDFVHFI
ncbi:MAG: nitroreductase family protein [Tissierellia bacterium]|nr:nitroreductase family protein [Tissierellia bacterium]